MVAVDPSTVLTEIWGRVCPGAAATMVVEVREQAPALLSKGLPLRSAPRAVEDERKESVVAMAAAVSRFIPGPGGSRPVRGRERRNRGEDQGGGPSEWKRNNDNGQKIRAGPVRTVREEVLRFWNHEERRRRRKEIQQKHTHEVEQRWENPLYLPAAALVGRNAAKKKKKIRATGATTPATEMSTTLGGCPGTASKAPTQSQLL